MVGGAEPRDDGLGRALHGVAVDDVDRLDQRACSQLISFSCATVEVEHRHRGAGVREGPDILPPQPPAPAGDECHLAGQVEQFVEQAGLWGRGQTAGGTRRGQTFGLSVTTRTRVRGLVPCCACSEIRTESAPGQTGAFKK